MWSLLSLYDETAIMSASSDSSIKLWDLETQKCLSTLKGHEKDVISLEFIEGKRLLASGSRDSTIRFWDLASGECVQLIYEGENAIKSLKSIEESEKIVSLNEKGVVLYDVRKFKKEQGVKGNGFCGGMEFFESVGCLAWGCEEEIRLFVQ